MVPGSAPLRDSLEWHFFASDIRRRVRIEVPWSDSEAAALLRTFRRSRPTVAAQRAYFLAGRDLSFLRAEISPLSFAV